MILELLVAFALGSPPLPPDVKPWPIGVGPGFRPAAAPAGVLRGEPVGRFRCAREGGRRFGVHLELFVRRRVLLVPAGVGVARGGCCVSTADARADRGNRDQPRNACHHRRPLPAVGPAARSPPYRRVPVTGAAAGLRRREAVARRRARHPADPPRPDRPGAGRLRPAASALPVRRRPLNRSGRTGSRPPKEEPAGGDPSLSAASSVARAKAPDAIPRVGATSELAPPRAPASSEERPGTTGAWVEASIASRDAPLPLASSSSAEIRLVWPGSGHVRCFRASAKLQRCGPFYGRRAPRSQQRQVHGPHSRPRTSRRRLHNRSATDSNREPLWQPERRDRNRRPRHSPNEAGAAEKVPIVDECLGPYPSPPAPARLASTRRSKGRNRNGAGDRRRYPGHTCHPTDRST